MAAYDLEFVAGIPGARANEEQGTIISRNAEVPVPFGVVVMQGASDNGCVIGDGTDMLGIAILDQSAAEVDDTPAGGGFGTFQSVRIMTEGVIWVTAATAVAAGDPVVLQAAGALGTAATGVTVTNARWDSSAALGGIAKVRLQSAVVATVA